MESNCLCIKETHLHIPEIQKKYRFLHITDAHLLLYDETETRQRAEYADPRYQYFTFDGLKPHERLQVIFRYIEEHSDPNLSDALDGVLLTGDIIDFPSDPNLKALGDFLEKLEIPYVYVLGNHDWAYFDDYHTPHSKVANRPLFSGWSNGNTFVQKKRIGELTFVAVDNTMELYEDGVAETLAEVLAGEENVLLMQHIPLYIPSLHEDTVSYWKSDINIGGEGICKNENWKTIRELILAENSPVKALITGHLHFNHEDMLGGKIPQYVTGTAAEGHMRLLVMEGKEQG